MAVSQQNDAPIERARPVASPPPKPVERDGLPAGRMLDLLANEAITVDPADTTAHRDRLRQLSKRATHELEAALQAELRAHRDSAEKKVEQLRRELASTADAMQEYVTRFAGQDQTQEKALVSDLERLATLRKMTNLNQIQAGLDIVRQSIAGTVEQIRAQNQAIIAQLRDEIRTLHKRLDSPERRETNAGSLVNRAPFERRIRAKVNGHEVFSLYLVRITNWKDLICSLDQEEAHTLVNNVSDKLGKILGPDTFAGRWYDGYFVAIIGIDKRAAMEGASDLAQQIAGVYPTGHVPVAIRVRVAVVDYLAGQDADQTLKRLDQLIRAFEG
ncbi:MAG: hypothetical protein K2X03_04885 [Bryobacteraceae bacterium]|nr:hypothetical protein [Bryobacteraceae bacterium]